jgi:hypothetical protein
MSKIPYHKRQNLNNYYKKSPYYNSYKNNNSSNLSYYTNNNKKYYYNNFDFYNNNQQYENIPNYNFKKNTFYNNQLYSQSYDDINNSNYSFLNQQSSKLINDEEKEEILKIKINVKGVIKDFILYKDDDIDEVVKNFCIDNNIMYLVQPLLNKIKYCIEISENFNVDKIIFDKEDNDIINKLNSIYSKRNSVI